jgi:protein-export membrane protein SecD
MSNLRIKWAFFVAVLLIAAYYFLPTVRYYSMEADQQQSQEKIRENAMKLGLDLQGGSYLVYEVLLDKIDLDKRTGDEIDQVIEVIRNRVDQYGVLEPVIQKQGDNRIVVQLPGLQDPTRARELVGKTARLDFLLVRNRQELFQAMAKVDQVIARRGADFLNVPSDTAEAGAATAPGDTAGTGDLAAVRDTAAAGDTTSAAVDSLLAGENPFSSLFRQVATDEGVAFCPPESYDIAKQMLDAAAGNPAHQKVAVLAGGTILLWGEREFTPGNDTTPGRYLYALTATPEITGTNIDKAQVSFNLDPARPNAPGVLLNLDKPGAAIFTRLTGNNGGRRLAIVLDQTVKSAPYIRDKIRRGIASITGLTGDNEARDLAIVLKAGALPTDIILLEERTVGPTLGRDSIEMGIRASVLGMSLVILVMAVYYRVSGLLAVLAMFLNLFFLFGALGALRGTLTLPGIAGIVLTIGMAVDANVLVLERIREEIRNGKTVRGAIDSGYRSAFRTILDSNLTTLISAVVLFQFGTGPIKGFATTLMIGIVFNVFTAVFVTRLIYDSVMARGALKKLSV